MFAGRYLGIIKDALFAGTFGATYLADVFMVAFRFPQTLRVFFADWTVYGTLVPELSKTYHDCPDKAKPLLQGYFSFMLVLVSSLVVCGELFAPYITPLLAPGFVDDPARSYLLVDLFRILLPTILFVSLGTTLVSLQNVLQRFWVQPSYRYGQDIVVILVIFVLRNFFEPYQFIHFVAWSVVFASILQLFFIILLCYKENFSIYFTRNFWTRETKKLALKMLRTAFATFGLYVLTFISVIFASMLAPGQITYLLCVDRLILVAVDAFGGAISTILLTYVGKFSGNDRKLSLLLEDIVLVSLQMSLVVAILVFLAAPYLVKILYGYGRFSSEDCLYVAHILQYAVWGMPAFALTRILSLYSISVGRAGIACVASTTSIAISICENYWFLHHGYGCVGIALATVIALWGGILCYAPLLCRIRWQFGVLTMLWNTIHALLGYLLWLYVPINMAVGATLTSYFVAGKYLRILRIGQERVLGL
jgi:putative peptidoglycan lipid II flippase